jgi:hypothetical protein
MRRNSTATAQNIANASVPNGRLAVTCVMTSASPPDFIVPVTAHVRRN